MRFINLLLIHILLGVIILTLHAEPDNRPVITKLDKSGNLHWKDTVSNASYRVEWATSLNGEWHTDLQELKNISSDDGTEHQAKMSIFYRVVRIDKTNLDTLNKTNTHNNLSSGRTYEHKACLKTGEIVLHTDKGLLRFCNTDWTPWRTMFGLEGNRLTSLPKPRLGFNYGHTGNGRGPKIMTNIGNRNWKDYSIEFTFGISGVSDRFNPYALSKEFRAGYILFHVVDAKESWNEKGDSWYALSIGNNGKWGLGCGYNRYCDSKSGWSNPIGLSRSLAHGEGLKLDDENGNIFRIDIEGAHIQIWVDGNQIVDTYDNKMSENIDGVVLDHGGVGFHWTHDCMGWIKDFSIQHFKRSDFTNRAKHGS